MNAHRHALVSFSEINLEPGAELLLGNGLGVSLTPRFAYSSLRDAGVHAGHIGDIEQNLFQAFGTADFELVLRRLLEASTVNQLVGVNESVTREHYDRLRTGLVKTLHEVHPSKDQFSSQDLLRIGGCLSQFSRVFTTNYDLLTYWAMSAHGFGAFTDYFFSSDLTFDPFNVEVWGKRTEVFYLHGALFLMSSGSGGQQGGGDHSTTAETRKLRHSMANSLLDQVDQELRGGILPIFVSEGRPGDKRFAIARNAYLTFAWQQFRTQRRELVVFGHSLSSSDSHIVDALNASVGLKHVAISIYAGTADEKAILDNVEWCRSRLSPLVRQGTQLTFFDSDTCPLSGAYSQEIT